MSTVAGQQCDLAGASRRKSPESFTVRLMLFLPLLVVVSVICFSPNFRSTPGQRVAPLGGDFLQDWVGGQIVAGTSPELLYDVEHFRAVQHDSGRLGFSWPESSYYPPVYPPFYYLLVSPLASIPYSQAMIVWAVFSGLAMVASGWLMLNFFQPCRKRFPWIWAGALFFAPTLTCFNIGHKSAILMLIMTATFVLLHHKKPGMAGLVFGMIAFKPHLGLLIGIAMLLKGQWRFVLGCLASVTVLVAISLATGLETCRGYVELCLGFGDYVQTGGYRLNRVYSLWGVCRLAMPGANEVIVKIIAGTLSAAICGMLYAGLRGKVETDSHRFALQFSALIPATVLLSPHFYFYDLVMVLPALFIILSVGSRLKIVRTIYGIPVQPDRIVLSLAIGFLLLAGTFSMCATATRIQPGVFILAGLIAAISFAVMPYRAARDSVRSVPADEP